MIVICKFWKLPKLRYGGRKEHGSSEIVRFHFNKNEAAQRKIFVLGKAIIKHFFNKKVNVLFASKVC